MKKTEREIYVVLSNEIDNVLCSFCKLHWSYGCSEGECRHPLYDVQVKLDNGYGMTPGDDCWGFRPRRNLSDTVDIVGLILANGWEVWDVWEDGGQLKVAGAKEWF